MIGARGGGRTRTPLPAGDFKSPASAIPPLGLRGDCSGGGEGLGWFWRAWGGLFDEGVEEGVADDVGVGLDVELFENAGAVGADGGFAELELGGGHFGGFAGGGVEKNLEFPPG